MLNKISQRNKKLQPIQRKKNKPIEIILEKDLMENILDKDLKTPASKMLKEQKESVEEIKKAG